MPKCSKLCFLALNTGQETLLIFYRERKIITLCIDLFVCIVEPHVGHLKIYKLLSVLFSHHVIKSINDTILFLLLRWIASSSSLPVSRSLSLLLSLHLLVLHSHK